MSVARVNARQVRQFAGACGQHSKTDRTRRLGAGRLPPGGNQACIASRMRTAMADLVARYRQLSHMVVQEKNRWGNADWRGRRQGQNEGS